MKKKEERRKKKKKARGRGTYVPSTYVYTPPANAREKDRWDLWYLVCFKINFT